MSDAIPIKRLNTKKSGLLSTSSFGIAKHLNIREQTTHQYGKLSVLCMFLKFGDFKENEALLLFPIKFGRNDLYNNKTFISYNIYFIIS